MAVILNKNSFWLHSQLTAFASKTTLARIDFLRQVDDWRTAKALIMLKFLQKTIQKTTVSQTRTWANGTKSTCAYCHLRERLQGMQPKTHGDRIMEMQKQPAVGRQFSAYGKEIE